MNKFDRLAVWLGENAGPSVDLSFDELEQILEENLPESAKRYAAYWSSGHSAGRTLAAAGWKARLRPSEGQILFERIAVLAGVEKRQQRVDEHASTVPASKPDLVLLGCVKTKKTGRHRAKDLYDSTLFIGRRAHAEATGRPWYILSAKYGLVGPDQEIDGYELALTDLSTQQRRSWSAEVLTHLQRLVGKLTGKYVEIHAGAEYRESGLVTGLREGGAVVNVPLEHLTLGQQLKWYHARYSGRAGQPVAGHDDIVTIRKKAILAPGSTEIPIADLVAELTGEFSRGEMDLVSRRGAPAPGWHAMPEFVAVEHVRDAGADDRQVRLFLTLTAALDRARDADRLWGAAAGLFADKPWLFEPAAIVKRTQLELRDVLALSGVSQRHLVDSAGWRLLAEALMSDASPTSVRAAINSGVGDARKLLNDLGAVTNAGQAWYPYLSGPKVSVMWVRMLAAPGRADIAHLDVVPVAVDVQVRKVTEYLGVTETAGGSMEQVRPLIQAAWRAGADAASGPEGLAGTSAAIDVAVWFFGKWGCTFCERFNERRPVGSVCRACRFTER